MIETLPKRFTKPLIISGGKIALTTETFPSAQTGFLKHIRCVTRPLSLFFSLLIVALCLTSCEHNMVIISDVDEREANEIVVFLANKGIPSEKVPSSSSSPIGGGGEGGTRWGISVESGQSTEAMAYLNQNGLPRKKGTSLLDLFAKANFMSSEKEETIRYQAGLAEQLASMIRKIDGVIDADVQLSFPPTEGVGVAPGQLQAQPKKITAAVFIKHQGIIDDPNGHLVMKIKRLVSGSITGLELNDVTIVSDRSRFTDISLTPSTETLEPRAKEYVSIWSIVMSQGSTGRFRILFFLLIFSAMLFAVIAGWVLWKFYPLLKKSGGLRTLLNPVPVGDNRPIEKETSQKTPEEKR